MIWQCGTRRIDLAARVCVMGIVNVTPDSFSDGGLYDRVEAAVAHGEQLVRDGADVLDIGGESTRPGAAEVSAAEEVRRVVPVIAALRARVDAAISIDTSKAEVAHEALAAGADIVNDVTALRGDTAMTDVVARAGCGVVLMHMIGTPRTMQDDPRYGDVVAEVAAFLRERALMAEAHGIARAAIAIDPGIGFGKTVEHNLELFRRMRVLARLDWPLLVGSSRKRFIGTVLDLPVDQRLEGTAATVAAAVIAGARIVRVHDVREMARVARMADALAPHREVDA